MASATENGWLKNLSRQIGIRRGVLIHGEILDVCYSETTADYRPISDVIGQTLAAGGFDHVVVWDKFAGVSNVSEDVWSRMQAAAAFGDQTQSPTGNEYDMGGGSPAQGTPARGRTPPSAEDFLSVVYHHMISRPDERCAFVVDWSNYLFGNVNSLSEQERQWLLIIAKAIRNSPAPTDLQSLKRPANLFVFLCSNLGGVPPALYRGNPAVTDIVIPSPGRVEREKFISRTIDKWSLRQTPSPGQIEFSDFVDALEGLALRDLQQMLRLSRQTPGEDPLTTDQLVNLYRYGEQKSPWEDLSQTKLRTIRDSLGKRVKGQDDAVAKVTSVIIRAFTGLSGLQHSRKQKMPKGVLFFVGPTGVGKTELAKALAQFLFGDEDACVRFDMSEFNHEHSDQRLVGAPPGYVGYEEGGQLTNAVKKRPFSVLLFDEIEKAHVRILDKFLQILEDGRLTDGKGETVYFSETVIIFTSNIGASEVQIQDDEAAVRKQFIDKVKDHFVVNAKRPELLNRIGENIVPFNFIRSEDFLVAIARTKLQPLRDRLKEKYRIQNLAFDDEERALTTIASSVDRQRGGRGVLIAIEQYIIDPLATFLFEREAAECAGLSLQVHQAGKEPRFTFSMS